jgi:hypothetical protein
VSKFSHHFNLKNRTLNLHYFHRMRCQIRHLNETTSDIVAFSVFGFYREDREMRRVNCVVRIMSRYVFQLFTVERMVSRVYGIAPSSHSASFAVFPLTCPNP